MSLREQVERLLRESLKAGDQVSLKVARLLKSEIRYREIEKGAELLAEDELSLLSSAVKRRKESIEAYHKGGRDDLAQAEEAELAVIRSFMPAPLSQEELSTVIDEAISETGAAGKADMGKVMKLVMQKVVGRADGKTVSAMVNARLK